MFSVKQVTTLLCALTLFSVAWAGTQDLQMTTPERVGMSSEAMTRIDNVIEDAIENGEIPMGAALVARNGKIVYNKNFGNASSAEGTPLKDDAIFRIASMTKAVTSVAAMQCYERGLFLMTDPISKYIPAFKNSTVVVYDDNGDLLLDDNGEMVTEVSSRPITVRDVLTHQAGMIYQPFFTGELSDLYLAEGVAEIFPFRRDESLEAYVNRYASLPMYTEPGGEVTYGVATDVLGRLVEVWSGQLFGDYCEEHIFAPLGMSDTSYFLPDGSPKADRVATMYTSINDGTAFELRETPEVGSELNGPRKLHCGAAGLLSTPTDYFRFCQMILNGGTFNGKRILSSRAVAMMTENQVGDVQLPDFLRILGDKTGFGLALRSERGVWDGMESLGTLSFAGIYWTRYWIDPAEELVVIAMTQAYTLDQSGFAHKVKNAAYSALVERGRPLRDSFKR